MKGDGQHQSKADREAAKERRKAANKAGKEKRKAEKKARKQEMIPTSKLDSNNHPGCQCRGC